MKVGIEPSKKRTLVIIVVIRVFKQGNALNKEGLEDGNVFCYDWILG